MPSIVSSSNLIFDPVEVPDVTWIQISCVLNPINVLVDSKKLGLGQDDGVLAQVLVEHVLGVVNNIVLKETMPLFKHASKI